MNDKQLISKAITIKGNKYVLVSDRINFFNEAYKNGCIQTKLLSEPNADMVVIYAKVTPDLTNPDRFFTGLSQAKWGDGMVNKTSAIENAETSAVGRALGMMGIGVIDSVASVDEIRKANTGSQNQSYASKQTGTPPRAGYFPPWASRKQVELALTLAKRTGRELVAKEIESMDSYKVSALINTMLKELGE